MGGLLTEIGLPIALGIIMLGLGLDLTVADFGRVRKHPKAVLVALACQLLLLPTIAFGLVLVFDLPPLLAIGVMLLAASPGGTTANLFSHLFRGDVALNITLTAINSVVALVTLPIITNLAIGYFDQGDSVSLPPVEVIKVFFLILVPVVIGMTIRARKQQFAARMDRPVRIASALVLAILVLAILAGEAENVGTYLAQVGIVSVLFCGISLATGFYVPRAAGVTARQSIACSFEIGVHNGTLAIFVAENILGENQVAVPAAVYSLVMFAMAALWGIHVKRKVAADPAESSESFTA